MSPNQTVKQKLQARLPGVSAVIAVIAVIDEPLKPDGPWMLDVVLDNRAVNVEWARTAASGFLLRSHTEKLLRRRA